jgi:AcrR family transcriptional regulator
MCPVARKLGRPKDPDLETRRKAEILSAAAAAFAEVGFAATKVQTIADRLGVGNGTIFRYFRTKEALFLAAVERGLKDLTEAMDAILATDADPLTQFRNVVRQYLRFFHDRPEMAELFIQERAAFPHHHRPLYFSTKDEQERCKHDEFFARLLASGAIRPIPQERFMGVIGDLLYGTILTNLLSGRPVDPDAQADDVLDVIGHGVLADPTKSKRGKK